jgi:putative membrane protein
MKHPIFTFARPLLATALLSTALLAADDAKNAGSTDTALAVSDQKFVLTASQGGMVEVQLGTLATQKGESDAVKKFGAQMVTDHTKANDELKSLASKKGMELPDQLDATHAGMVGRLSTLEGPQFDKAYIEGMVKDHEEDVHEFEAAAKSLTDPALKAFAAKTLPTLKMHLKHIKGIESGKVK